MTPQFSSPACSMHEADDAYMGYAGREELIMLLNELLEAVRAGSQAIVESAPSAAPECLAQMLSVQHDDRRWCVMLTDRVASLGAQPSPKTADLCAKAMAIPDLQERLAFLNRGRRRIAANLREMLPRVRDEHLHADLAAMLRSQESALALLGDPGS